MTTTDALAERTTSQIASAIIFHPTVKLGPARIIDDLNGLPTGPLVVSVNVNALQSLIVAALTAAHQQREALEARMAELEAQEAPSLAEQLRMLQGDYADVNSERQRWKHRTIAAEARVGALEARVRELEHELAVAHQYATLVSVTALTTARAEGAKMMQKAVLDYIDSCFRDGNIISVDVLRALASTAPGPSPARPATLGDAGTSVTRLDQAGYATAAPGPEPGEAMSDSQLPTDIATVSIPHAPDAIRRAALEDAANLIGHVYQCEVCHTVFVFNEATGHVCPMGVGDWHAATDENVRTAIRALAGAAAPPAGWRPTHRHKKRGTTYVLVGGASIQTGFPLGDNDRVTVYRGEDGQLWVRPTEEFNDGRFEWLPAPPPAVPEHHD